MNNVYFKSRDGKYYTEYEIKKALEIVYGINMNDKELTELDIREYIDDGKLKNIYPGTWNPTLEDLIKSGNKPAAVRKYYNEQNKNSEVRITLLTSKDYIDSLERMLKTT